MARKPDKRSTIIDAALTFAADGRWSRVSLGDIAAAAGVDLADLITEFPSRDTIMAAFSRRVDEAVVAGITDEDGAMGARDRLFDVLMRRFDALGPHKAAVRGLLRHCTRDPVSAARGACRLAGSMALMLEAAGISGAGLAGLVRTKGLAAIYMATLRVWLSDDSEDMAKTMAALDRNLRRAEQALGNPLCAFLTRDGTDRPKTDGAADPAQA